MWDSKSPGRISLISRVASNSEPPATILIVKYVSKYQRTWCGPSDIGPWNYYSHHHHTISTNSACYTF